MSPDRSADAPTVPSDRLEQGGWELRDDLVETVFQLPTATVTGHTLLYEDSGLREQVREATGLDRPWRFFFATALAFQPSLAPGIAPLISSTVAREARKEFATDLEERGFRNVERGRTERVRIDGNRARLTTYRATYPVEADDAETELQVTGHLAVWNGDGYRLAGGVYPEAGLDDVTDGVDASAYREELLDLIRSVR
ncbi:hypothetical protein [Halorarius halobius]|uniref:hypothetical protein n=1 Tax=Halorarius halobius TaxID=2962671 RepID=UPI0020CE3166|nr:hypothetical protein [Halorarius halobius]